jgi:putative ABC transport system permease protein
MEFLRAISQDLRYAVRNLLKAPGFTAVAVLTLTIGIGANTAIFSIIDTVLLRPLPYRNPEQLLRLYETEAAPGHYPFAGPDFVDWKAQNKTFQDMTLIGWQRDYNLRGEGQLDHVLGVPTEANFFALLGVQPLLGRTWAAGEDQPGKDQVAILSYALWRSRFAGDPAVIGRSIELNSKKHTIIGVMPPGFRLPDRAQLWVPLDMDGKSLGTRGNHWAWAIGRLKPGVPVQTAVADLKLIAGRLEQAYPKSNEKVGAGVVPLHEELVGDSRSSLLMMLSAVGLVLLIACANVANLLLSRAAARQKEMAVRSALGAGRARLLRQLLTESLVLSIVGGALGCLVGWGLIASFAKSRIPSVPQFTVIQLNGEVLAFTFALAVLTGVLFGIVPALRTSRPDLHDELKGGAGSVVSPNRRRRTTSNALVAAEMALSLLLLISAGLLLKDFIRMRSLDIGVRAEGVLTAAVRLPDDSYKAARQQFDFAAALLDKCRRIPGVETAALSDHLPLEGGSNYYIKLRGSSEQNSKLVENHSASSGYFQAMGIRLIEGRLFNDEDVQRMLALDEMWHQADEAGRRPTPEQTNGFVTPVVINQAMARYFWPGASPLGQMFSQGSDTGPWRQVVGVVSDVRQWGLTTKAVPEAYDPFDAGSGLFVVLRTRLDPSSLTPQVRRVLAEIDPGMPLFSVRTMPQVIAEHAQGQQFLSLLVGSFAALALLLAAVGIYGVLSYVVTQRTREIGIRMSLGATRGRVLAEVLREGLLVSLIGFALGLAGAFSAGRVLASVLHEVKPADPEIFALTAGLLLSISLIACYVPARRAARLDPMSALRHE